MNAADAVHRYYSIALPLHEADENESVYQRLWRKLDVAVERAAWSPARLERRLLN